MPSNGWHSGMPSKHAIRQCQLPRQHLSPKQPLSPSQRPPGLVWPICERQRERGGLRNVAKLPELVRQCNIAMAVTTTTKAANSQPMMSICFALRFALGHKRT